jgi:pimeloyl-ACP methyl ester carboxylesterase
MDHASTLPSPPSRWLLWAESRAAHEFAATLAAWPLLRLAPKGDGHPVLVLPGLVASDASTRLLRAYLRERGYDTHGWGLGRNLGPHRGVATAMLQRLDQLHERSGRRVSLVGWSLGGAYARRLAAARPDAMRNTIMLGSPLEGNPRSSNAWRLYEATSGKLADDATELAAARATVSSPMTSIYSRSDGVVAWTSSRLPSAPQVENIEVHGSHVGLGVNGAVLLAIADRLAQREGEWKPFAGRRTLMRPLYPDPDRDS